MEPQTVLVLDDEDSVRNVVTRMLRASGYASTGVATAAAALALFDEGKHFDLLICDQRMPGMTGNECLERVWALAPDQNVLRIAGALQDADDAARELGRVTPVLIKPFTMERLLAAVRDAISFRP